MQEIILASKSPRRAELLKNLGIPFRIVHSNIDEKLAPGSKLSSFEFALEMASRKARAVASKYPQAVVMGADTVVCFDGMILGKPVDRADARRMLHLLSGSVHEVSTGVVLRQESTRKFRCEVVTTKVFFRDLTPEEIEGYLATGEPFDKAGGYGIQGYGALLVEKIEGCYFNVVGLPLAKLGEMLKGFGVELLCPCPNTTLQ